MTEQLSPKELGRKMMEELEEMTTKRIESDTRLLHTLECLKYAYPRLWDKND